MLWKEEVYNIRIRIFFLNKNNENIFDLSIANIFRLKENPDLPKIHNLSEKRSNFIGNLNISLQIF